jgi:hypothetical protein
MKKFMRSLFHKFVAFAIVFALATGSAQAALFSLNFDGLTSGGSTLTDGTAISNGTAFPVHGIFSYTPSGVVVGPGLVYQVSAINFTVGGAYYSVTAGSIGNYLVGLADPSSFSNYYGAALLKSDLSEALFPVYGTAAPALDKAHPSATAFSDYLGSVGSSLTFSTAGGNLTLAYDEAVGVNAAIAAVPEPEEWAMMLVGFGLVGWQAKRKHKLAA